MKKNFLKIAVIIFFVMGINSNLKAQIQFQCSPCGPCWSAVITTPPIPNTTWIWEYCFTPSCGSMPYTGPQPPCMQCPGQYCSCPCRISLYSTLQPLAGSPLASYTQGSMSSSGCLVIDGNCYNYSYTVIGNSVNISYVFVSPCPTPCP
jgi:hypothetical protein